MQENVTQAAECSVDDKSARSDYERARSQEGLARGDLGFGTIVTRTNALLIGAFTSFLYAQLTTVVPGNKTWQLAAISLSITLLVLAAERFYFDTIGASLYLGYRSWARVFMQFSRFFIIILVFITTNYIIAVFTETTQTQQLTFAEAIALILITMLSFFYFLNVYSSFSM